MKTNPVIWTVYKGNTSGSRVSFKKVYEGPHKRKAVVAALNARGGKYAPIHRDGHTYTVIPRR